MITWPSSITGPLIDGIQYVSQSNVIRSEFPGGSKARRQFTRVYEEVSFQLLLTRDGAQVIHDFCAITCADVMPFQWVEFRDPSKRPATYVFKTRPTFRPAGTNTLWIAEIQLELRTPFNGQFYITNGAGGVLESDGNEGLTT